MTAMTTTRARRGRLGHLLPAILVAVLSAPAAAQLTATGDTLVAEDAFGGTPRSTGLFGSTLVVGDFDGDGYQDLVAGAPGLFSERDAGVAYVAYGSATGLDPASTTVLAEGAGLETVFGWSFAVGDFDGDRYDDLAAGAPGIGVSGQPGGGAVTFYTGGPGGLVFVDFITQATPRIQGGPEADDFFGYSLVSDDFNGDGFDDLAVGVPGEAIGSISSTGAVQVLYGSASGITILTNQFFDQSVSTYPGTDVPGVNEPGDSFGLTLEAGDFDGDGYAELVIGVPGEGIGSAGNAGAVVVLPGSPTGTTTAGSYSRTQSGTASTPETGNRFGEWLGVGDFDADSRLDLAVGVPGQRVDGAIRAGAVQILRGTGGELSAASGLLISQSGAILGSPEPDDRFGRNLAVADLDLDGYDDLIVGTPPEDIGTVEGSGAVNVIYGSDDLLTTAGNELWSQDTPGVEGDVQEEDAFGSALVAGDFDGGGPELVVGVPGETVGAFSQAGRIQIFPNGISGAPDTALVLSDRFRVQVEWDDGTRSGFARDVLTSGNSGIFSFFDTANWEVMVKVLDACTFSGNYWVFFAGTTDVGFTLEVEDTATGATQMYSNPVGNTAETVTDTMAFSTCP